ncbi:MAG: phosphate signaling complex protein PhoU [Phycisphaerae bacterium]
MATHFINLLDELMRRSLRMGAAVEDMLLEACEAVTYADHNLARRIIDRDAEIDAEEVAIEAETVRLMTLFQPMGADMRRLCTILKVNNDLERIADCGVNIAERAVHLQPDTLVEARHNLKDIYPVVRRMLHGAIHAYATLDRATAEKVMAEDEIIDAFYGDFVRHLVIDAAGSPEIMAAHLDILSVAKNLERTADHAVNIAEDVIFLVTGQIIRHGPKNLSA